MAQRSSGARSPFNFGIIVTIAGLALLGLGIASYMIPIPVFSTSFLGEFGGMFLLCAGGAMNKHYRRRQLQRRQSTRARNEVRERTQSDDRAGPRGGAQAAGEASGRPEAALEGMVRVRFELARKASAAGKDERAISLLEDLVRDFPEVGEAWFLLGLLYQKYDTDDAIAAFEETVLNQPENADALAALGQMHVRKGTRVKARSALNHALALDPDNIVALTGIMQYYEAEENWTKALPAAEKLLGLVPDNAELEQHVNELRDRREDAGA